jgi:hypothetical protein
MDEILYSMLLLVAARPEIIFATSPNLTAPNDPVENDPIENDPIEDDSTEDDPVEDDPVEDDPVADDPAEDECSGFLETKYGLRVEVYSRDKIRFHLENSSAPADNNRGACTIVGPLLYHYDIAQHHQA